MKKNKSMDLSIKIPYINRCEVQELTSISSTHIIKAKSHSCFLRECKSSTEIQVTTQRPYSLLLLVLDPDMGLLAVRSLLQHEVTSRTRLVDVRKKKYYGEDATGLVIALG